MTQRTDAEPLSLLDRFELVKTGIAMIEEGIQYLFDETMEESPELDPAEVAQDLDMMAAEAYAALLHSMVNTDDEAKQLVRLLRLEVKK